MKILRCAKNKIFFHVDLKRKRLYLKADTAPIQKSGKAY
jgi:hypothetical protein